MSDTPIRQPVSAYHHRLGEILVTVVNEGFNARPLPEGFIRNATSPEIQAALAAAGLATDALPITFSPLIIRTGGEVILIDTGFADNGPPTTGQLRDNMTAAGIAPGDVTKVVISHFHGDHINGLCDAAGVPCYPNATVMVPRVEWAYWTDTANAAGQPDMVAGNFANVAKVFASIGGAVQQYDWDDVIAPGVTAIAAPGHTPGHTAYRIDGGKDQVLIHISDVTNHPALFMKNPHWQAAFDMDRDGAVDTRRRILGDIADQGLLVTGYHIPFPCLGRLARDGDGFRHIPAQWMAQI